MADFTTTQGAGAYAAYDTRRPTVTSTSNTLAMLTNTAGAAISLALIVGVGVWGYELLMRDVTGIPVVRAVEGEMRVRPAEADIGGQFARHQGLAVNAVAAEGTAAEPADSLRLAPQPVDLAEEDQPMTSEDVATAPQREPATDAEPEDIVAAIQSGAVDELVAQLTNGVAPIEDMRADVNEVLASVVSEATAATKPPLDGPGLRRSLRPVLRPVGPEQLIKTSAPAPATTPDVDASSLPAGTRLVQLGAFDSAEIARTQWDKLQSRFGHYLEGKSRVVQEAQSGGRTFYRLRAMGFDDIADARRFCSALVAENADCIPVVTR